MNDSLDYKINLDSFLAYKNADDSFYRTSSIKDKMKIDLDAIKVNVDDSYMVKNSPKDANINKIKNNEMDGYLKNFKKVSE